MSSESSAIGYFMQQEVVIRTPRFDGPEIYAPNKIHALFRFGGRFRCSDDLTHHEPVEISRMSSWSVLSNMPLRRTSSGGP